MGINGGAYVVSKGIGMQSAKTKRTETKTERTRANTPAADADTTVSGV